MLVCQVTLMTVMRHLGATSIGAYLNFVIAETDR